MFTENKSCFKLALLFLCFSINIYLSFGADTIYANQSISGNQTIVSSDGNFELGFFKPGKSSRYYIGFWYKKVSVQTVVWVANREKPVSNEYSSELKILDGNLVLLDESKTAVWSTNTSSKSPNLVAVLLDGGNFVLRSESDSNSILWQSLDNPSNTWLPGGKIAYDKRTNRKQLLTSWTNSEDPAPGLFSLELDPNGSQYLIKWNRSREYWTSGPWNGQIFSSVPEMRVTYIYNFSFVSNENESYFTYNLYNSEIISRFIMDYSGQVRQLTWLDSTNEWNLFWSQPRVQCEVYALCGAYGTCQNSLPFCNCLKGFTNKSESDWSLGDYSGGCVRQTELQCGNNSNTAKGEKKDRFWMNSQMGLPINAQSVAVGSTAECESTCLSNCSCIAYSYDSNTCSIWSGDLLNLKQLS